MVLLIRGSNVRMEGQTCPCLFSGSSIAARVVPASEKHNVVKAVPGTYDIDVNGQRAHLTVLAPRTVLASVPSAQDTGIGMAGIIAILAVMMALVLGLVMVFKK